MPHDDLAAILLVGGRSSRMGRAKPWLDLDGRPLLVRMVERVRTWVDEIVLVAAPEQDLPAIAATANAPAPRVVRDTHPGEGPLPALAVGLRAVAVPWALVLGCDAPLVRSEIVARLAQERAPDCDAVVPIWDDRPQPLVALYRTTLAPALATLVAAGERRLHAVADGPRVRRISAESLRLLDPAGDSFRTMNTPEEFQAAVTLWRTRRDRP